ncbi:MAG: hypothetical protein RL757_1719 [Bacteroidota bacterium]|jgi:hypothetical protein
MKIVASRLALIFFLSSVLLFSNCGSSDSAENIPLSDEKLIAALVDVQLAEAIPDGEIPEIRDSMMRVYYPQIFEKHGISAVDFDSSMSHLAKQPRRLEEIHRKVSEQLLKKQQ